MTATISEALKIAGDQRNPIRIRMGDAVPYINCYVLGDWLFIDDQSNRDFSGCRMNIWTLEFDTVVSKPPCIKVFRTIFENITSLNGHVRVSPLPITIEIGSTGTDEWETGTIYIANVIPSVDRKRHFLIGVELLFLSRRVTLKNNVLRIIWTLNEEKQITGNCRIIELPIGAKGGQSGRVVHEYGHVTVEKYEKISSHVGKYTTWFS